MINVRVSRRSLDNIILLWDINLLSKEDRDNVKIFNENKVLKIRLANSLKELTNEKLTIPDQTAVCLINHEENGLDAYKTYVFTVDINNKYVQDIEVLPYGVLPEKQKDDKEKHVQLFAWDNKQNRWRKVCGIETEHGFALLIKNIK